MGKSCANERNESSLSNCRVQPALSIKEGRGDFRKDPSLWQKKDWSSFERILMAREERRGEVSDCSLQRAVAA